MSIWLTLVICAGAAATILWHHLANAKALSEALLGEYERRLAEARQQSGQQPASQTGAPQSDVAAGTAAGPPAPGGGDSGSG